jgi:hypothetical protein
MASLLLAAVFGAVAQAVALESTIAQPTDASILHPTAQVPEVTQPPDPSMVRELLRRADVQTVLVGPDNTCGYVSGLLGMLGSRGYVEHHNHSLTYLKAPLIPALIRVVIVLS